MNRPPYDEWLQGNDAGGHVVPVTKLLIHDTEGSSISGAVAAYKANNSWPHLTVDCRFGKTPWRVGHLDLGVAARALRNEPGGVETNRAGVIQIEVVGFATMPADIDWAWFGKHVAWPICQATGVPWSSTVPWFGYPASYGKAALQRLSPADWTAYRGILGHQHVPENSHGDPGAIPIDLVLAAAPTVPQEDTLSAAEVDEIKDHIDRTRPFLAHDPGDPNGTVFLITRDGTKRWVDSQAMLHAVVKDGARASGQSADGTPLAYRRTREHLAALETVGPVPDGW